MQEVNFRHAKAHLPDNKRVVYAKIFFHTGIFSIAFSKKQNDRIYKINMTFCKIHHNT